MKLEILHVIILATTACLLTACSSEEYLGAPPEVGATGNAISFNGGTGRMTRAGGAEAAEKLGGNFVVYGFKTNNDTKSTVYNHYNVKYTDGTANSTESNTAGWEYVGQAPNVLNAQLSSDASYTQDIKYWDFAADRYDFIAFSAGAATQQAVTGTPGDPGYPGTPATGKVIFTPVDNAHLTDAAYTITGATSDLTKVYIADRVSATKETTTKQNLLYPYKNAIQFAFKPLAAKVRIGLYETIPGYSVKDVKFYQQPISASGVATPYLYAGTQTIPSGKGIINVSFPEETSSQPAYNKAVVKYDSEGEKTQTLTLGALTATTAPEQSEKDGNIYLARTSSSASMTSDVLVVPAPASDLTLKVDFTLVSIDYNETINVKGAIATIPAQYTNWQSNYAYTYLFKIGDSVTNAFGQQLLYPVVFDALETVDDDGTQMTITTVDQPSITTYAKGALPDDNKYKVGDNIYVAVTNGTAKFLDVDNAKLYTVSTSLAEENITENNIEDGIDGITLNPVASGFMTFTEFIAAKDSPSGDRVDAVTGSNFAKFTAENNIYVFQYKVADAINFTQEEINNATDGDPAYGKTTSDIKTPAEYHYKVIKINE